tara:strand:- start:433 stop:996 length:564 start_codon:yes stop_codon:yes gene_type:complete
MVISKSKLMGEFNTLSVGAVEGIEKIQKYNEEIILPIINSKKVINRKEALRLVGLLVKIGKEVNVCVEALQVGSGDNSVRKLKNLINEKLNDKDIAKKIEEYRILLFHKMGNEVTTPIYDYVGSVIDINDDIFDIEEDSPEEVKKELIKLGEEYKASKKWLENSKKKIISFYGQECLGKLLDILELK